MKFIFFKRSLFLIVLLFALHTHAQSDTINNTNGISTKPKKSFLKRLWGDPTKSSVTAMPIGLHTDFEKHSSKRRSTINGLHEALYFAVNYKNVELSVFQNSFGDATIGLGYKRTWNFTKRFSANFGAGLIYGYDGRLRNTEGIPLRDTFLIKGDVNPVIGLEFDYRFYKRWSVHTSIAPNIIVYGFRFLLNKNDLKKFEN